MSVTLSGTGGLFTRIGKIGAYIRHLNGVRGESAAVGNLNTGYVNYVDVLAATTTGKATQLDLDGVAEPSALAGVVQPDVPRNIRLTFTDGDASITAYSVTVVGTGPDGAAVSETFTFADGLTPSGSKIFAKITSITLTSIAGNGAGDLLDVGHGVKIGVPTPVNSSGLTITLLQVDGVTESPSATDATNRSFTATTAPNGTRDYAVTYTWTETAANWGSTSGPKIKDTATGYNEIKAQFESNLQFLMDGLYTARNALRSAITTHISILQTLAQNTLIEQVHADAVLTRKDLTIALTELIRQMGVSADLVTANSVSVSVSAASGNVGNATAVASVVGPTGVNSQYVFPETMELKATNDGQQGGGATAGSEAFSLTGEVAESDRLQWNWPDGSGAAETLSMCDPTVDQGVNLLKNSCFDLASSDVPTSWEVTAGAAATDIFTELTNVDRSGGKGVEFRGTGGSPLSALTQKFANAGLTGGNTTLLKPNTKYAVNVRLKKSASLAAGAIQISLVQSSDGTTVVNDDAGNANSITIAHGSIATSFGSHNGFITTPKTLPSGGVRLRIRVSTALTSGESVYVDDLAMCEAKRAYVGGPYVAIFRGTTDVKTGDLWNITVSNDQAGVFQTLFDRLFDMRNKGLQLPTGSATIADSLVA